MVQRCNDKAKQRAVSGKEAFSFERSRSHTVKAVAKAVWLRHDRNLCAGNWYAAC
jgi:hypothetical protein